jgi:hypothetical protein
VTGQSHCLRSIEAGLWFGDSAIGDPRQTWVSDRGTPVLAASDGGDSAEQPDSGRLLLLLMSPKSETLERALRASLLSAAMGLSRVRPHF